MIPTGFSIAMRLHFALAKCKKNCLDRSCVPSACFLAKCLAPLAARSVHGGNAIIISHSPSIRCCCPSIVVNVQSPLISGNTSPRMCHSGCPPDGSCISALYASCPRALNALHTVCDSSQATNTLNPFLSPNHQEEVRVPSASWYQFRLHHSPESSCQAVASSALCCTGCCRSRHEPQSAARHRQPVR